MKHLRYTLEAIALFLFWAVCKILPPAAASNMGGFLGRTFGAPLAASRKIRKNLVLAMPHLSTDEQDDIILGAWDNMGRLMAEYPHIKTIGKNRITVTANPDSEALIRSGDPVIFITTHSGNWEAAPAALLYHFDRPVHATYREPNNPYSAWLLDRSRRYDPRIDTISKSKTSGRYLMKKMKEKEILGILIDQKFNEGISVPFFGHDAKTTTIFATLAQKYNAHLIPVSNVRTGSARYDVTVHAPMNVKDENGENLPVETVVKNAHMIIEGWIKNTPREWMWMHRRWPKELYKDL